MALVTLRDVSVGFGGPLLLEHVDLQVDTGERVCLVGRNGTGKSTLLKVIRGDITPDDGRLEYRQDIRLAYLPQETPPGLAGSVFEVVAGGLGREGELIAGYHRLSASVAEGHGRALLDELARTQHELEAAGGWAIHQRVEETLSRMQLAADTPFETLSGGLARRVLLARALVGRPHLLLLDEPTNHLDIEAIQWLEDFLRTFKGALLFVTHDRMLVRALATRIVELDRGRVESYPGDYAVYLKRKEEGLKTEAAQDALFDKRLAQEEAWIRQGIKARRTRNEGRVRALERMRELRRARRVATGKARLTAQDPELSGKIVIEARDVGYRYGERPIVRDFSTTILRGDKVGILGPNGAGKSTLLQLLLGRLRPDHGRVKLGTRLEVAYFDQHRGQLDEQKSVRENVGQGSDKVTVNGHSRHVISYLQDFLFAPERARTAVRNLSGGERNRLLLAKLFTKPSNLLVMDEPTNDLDVETLELLEELLTDYPGTLLLVSHDRAFINNIVTSTLVLEGQGSVNEYVGGYDDWLRQRGAQPVPPAPQPAGEAGGKPGVRQARPARPGLGYKEQRELAALPQRIDEMEAQRERLFGMMADPQFYKRDAGDIAATTRELESVEAQLEACYRRWEELESLAK